MFLETLNNTLNQNDFRTKMNSESIEFEKIFRFKNTSNVAIREGHRNLRTGRIELLKQSREIIIIKCIIDINHLTIFTTLLGLAFFLIGLLWDYNLILNGILSGIVILVAFFVNWTSVVDKIDSIIQITKENT